ncbi:hypothetical protein [Chamaesiphon polymorphus]|uniref:Glycosyl transferase n=1 Tax=Chamaesiphon polymorphus CCALA 037 TaxID=2107692 RepID=A0A2T1GMW3_9CYAN|nr:hypothetical protein [Chamaesiphon polymorphus]PSB59245.1 hypothetical protein C7B77_01720 [Chamaesiphon polymorphus CCALA 037]
MAIPIAFIMCTEGGQLERESLLMVESFRKYTGSYQNAPIYSFQVRERNDVSPETIDRLKAMNVEHQKVVLNTKYPNYPLANKPLLCAYVEQTIDAELLVFLDSDLVFFSEPTEFLLPPEYDVGIRPEHHQMIGSAGSSDPNDEYWIRLYSIAGVKDIDRFVTTTVDQKKIRAFWNSGVVVVRRNKGIFTAWQQTIEQLLEEGTSITTENWYYEQSALSATICAITDRIWHFSPGYNYPIHSHNQLINTERRQNFDEIVCIHDHFFRSRPEAYRERTWVKTLKIMKDFDLRSDKYLWLYSYLQEHNPKQNPAQSFLETILFLPMIKYFLTQKK